MATRIFPGERAPGAGMSCTTSESTPLNVREINAFTAAPYPNTLTGAADAHGSSNEAAAIHTDRLTGDIPGILGREKRAGGSDIFGTSRPLHRRAGRRRRNSTGESTWPIAGAKHRRVDKTRRNIVDSDTRRRELQRQRLGKGDHATLRRGVGRHTCAAGLSAR